jgi:hypothetical protein
MERRQIISSPQSKALSVSGRTPSGRGAAGPSTRSRTPSYRAAVSRLDSGQITDSSALRELIAEIRAELGEAGLPDLPTGLVAECFLGPPFRVHTLDLLGEIVTHYEAGKAMPAPFEAARSLALHPAYVLVEVYADHMVAIRADGTATRI